MTNFGSRRQDGAECGNIISFALDTKIEDNSRGFKLQKANFDSEVNTAVSLKFLQRGILLFIPFL